MSGGESAVDLAGIETYLGVRFSEPDLGRLAASPWVSGFSRLEFLGDAILGLAVFSAAELIGLARTTAISRVSNDHLDDVFNERLASLTSANTGDVIEALIGAVHLDLGFGAAATVARRLCLPEAARGDQPSREASATLSARSFAFVGSAVFSASVADHLCIQYPHAPHRWLSEQRAVLLARRRLAACSVDLGYSPDGDLENETFRASAANALEVLLGDQFFRWGWEEARASAMRVADLNPPRRSND